ncbi:MAG: hypothetical protein K2G36_07600 [Ruminococcus sp.]|nr:hypothetical protein [Ruminococcus sp.]
MINKIIDEVIEKLSAKGLKEVYSEYDAIPADRKSRQFYIIIGSDTFESQQPVYSPANIFLPYKAVISVRVTAPENYSMNKLYEYFSGNVKPVIMENTGTDFYIKRVSMKHDTQISRLVLTAEISVTGIEKYERNPET